MKDKAVWFIDIGCGPFTSGLAFNSLLSNFADLNLSKVNYIGVDTSPNMLLKAEAVKKRCLKMYYSDIVFRQDKNEILDVLQNITQYHKDLLFILNYSYLFASNSLDVQDFVDFTKGILGYGGNVIILQQNPRLDILNLKWTDYKSQLQMFKSKENYPQPFDFQFDDVLGSSNFPSPTFKVRCDLLKSF